MRPEACRFPLLCALGQPAWIAVSVLAACLLFGILSPHFWTADNVLTILDQSSINLILAVGMTFVIAGGGIDLSVGSTVALCGVVTAGLIRLELPPVVAACAGLCTGMLVGFGNGWLVACRGINPFMATLVSLNVVGGGTLMLTQGNPIYGFSASLSWLGRGTLAGLPVSFVICAAVTLTGVALAAHSRLGLYAVAMGCNEPALRRVGVPVIRYKTALYALCGLCAAVGSLLLTAKLNSAEPLAGLMMEMNAIATTVLGGTAIQGGVLRLWGTCFAGLLLGVVRNGLVLIGVSSYYQQFAVGLIVLLAVLVAERNKHTEDVC